MTTKETITLNNVSDVQLPGIMFRYIRNDCSGVFGIRAQLRRNMQVNNLTKSFSGRKVINDLSFEVNKGEVFAMLGHNGAGKSTTIDLILGLKCPDERNIQN